MTRLLYQEVEGMVVGRLPSQRPQFKTVFQHCGRETSEQFPAELVATKTGILNLHMIFS